MQQNSSEKSPKLQFLKTQHSNALKTLKNKEKKQPLYRLPL